MKLGMSVNDFTFIDVTTDKVGKQLASMPAKSSPADFLSTSVVKACPWLFVKVANLSFSEDSFPKRLVSNGEAVSKKEGVDMDAPSNYRSRSNLSAISQSLERLTYHFVTKLQIKAQSVYPAKPFTSLPCSGRSIPHGRLPLEVKQPLDCFWHDGSLDTTSAVINGYKF